MSAKIIDGKAFATKLRTDIATRVAKLKAEKGITPGLAVVLVGNDPASEVYVKSKGKQTLEAGMNSYEFKLPETTTEAQLLEKVRELNNNPQVHGILVQLPLPKHINEDAIINAISPDKDVDGFHVINAGRLATGQEAFVPCTPLGCLMLLKDTVGNLAGKHAVVIGRSNIVGKPMAALLLKESCTITIAHSKTANLPDVVKLADIVVAAVGRPEMVKGEWLKRGAVVIDVGINRLTMPDGKTKLVGDVDFESCSKVASAITPVPGGVGPMTIACLLENTLKAANK
ncbi:MAG: bifunctional methylenetetrahydrofolate dehydrogenase/methenyltetrahydrofolate cyclohydrolase FolD [Alphaproteobacteria bacterium]